MIPHYSHFVNGRISFFSFSLMSTKWAGVFCMFWDNYVALCSKHGVSPNAVAAELGKSSGSVTAWKNGASPRETTIKQIADYFRVSVDVLLYGGLPWEIAATKAELFDLEQKEKSSTPVGAELQLTDMQLLEAYKNADEVTQELIRRALGLK
jgi:transcriptional regulator with XRE-family HTH domain